MPRRPRLTCFLLIGLFAAAVGCVDKRHPGSGAVRFDDGEPVRAGSVELRLRGDGSLRYAGRIGRDGGFQVADLKGKPGLPPGEYEAVVVQVILTEDLALEHHQHGRNVPRRYADYYTSGLAVEVTEGGDAQLEIVLSAE